MMSKEYNDPLMILDRMKTLIQNPNSFKPGRRNTDCMNLAVNMAHLMIEADKKYIVKEFGDADPHASYTTFILGYQYGDELARLCFKAIEKWENHQFEIRERAEDSCSPNYYIVEEMHKVTLWVTRNVLEE